LDPAALRQPRVRLSTARPRGRDHPPRERRRPRLRTAAGDARREGTHLARRGKVRTLRGAGLGEGVSTRLLVYAGQLIVRGLSPRRACTVAVTNSLTDDAEMTRSVGELVSALFPPA